MTKAPRDRSALLLLALVTALVAELVRASGPLLDRAFSQGVLVAAGAALATYLAPALAVALLMVRRSGRGVTGRVVLVGVSLLVAARLALQLLGAQIATASSGAGIDTGLGAARYFGGLGTVALGLGVLVLVAAFVSADRTGSDVPAADGGSPAARGLLVARGVTLGLLGSGALNVLLGTWDAVWRGDVGAWAVTIALAAGTLVAAWRQRALPTGPGARGLWVIGPFVALGVQMWANPAFIASQTGFSLTTAAVVVAVAALTTGVTLSLLRPRVGPLLLGAAFVIGVWLVYLTAPLLDGPPTWWAFGLLVVAAAVPALGARTIAIGLSRTARPLGPRRLVGIAAATGLTTVLPILLYQLDYDVPLPVANGLVPVAAAVAVAAPSVVRARHLPLTRTPAAPGLTAVVVALALAGGALAEAATTDRDTAPQSRPDGSLGVLTWNLHYGVSAEPSVRLDEMARVIERSQADVVGLQEVSRGWVLGGGADMATYLANATGMELMWAPAADRQFGNAVLWDPDQVALLQSERVALPYGEGPQERSALAVELVTRDGGALTFVTTHLQHREENHATRLDQLAAIFDAVPVEGPYLLAGDLNSEPGWSEIGAISDQGLVSGQDAVGDPDALTSPAVTPRYRVDWVFATPDRPFSAFEVLDVTTSDHRPLVATLEAGS